jgi:4-amino-4-deoxy-L-arabinose transferase-like glycosyltransferase
VSTEAVKEAVQEPSTLSEALLGKEVLKTPLLAKLLQWPIELRATLVSIILSSLVFLPFLGAVGLWDCWEVHYGEVAREMIQRNDYVHPFWENAYFFSKPAFTMWMQATGLQAAELGPPLALVLGLLLAGFGFALFIGKLGKPTHTKEF